MTHDAYCCPANVCDALVVPPSGDDVTASSASGLLTKDSLTACVCSFNRCARLERKGCGFTTNWKRDQFQPGTVVHHGGVTTVRDATTVDKQRERHCSLPRVP